MQLVSFYTTTVNIRKPLVLGRCRERPWWYIKCVNTLSLRSNHQRSSMKKLFLKISQCSLENTCVGVFLYKIAGLKACNFIKKRLQHRYFSVNIAKFLRITILKNICERLLLDSARQNSSLKKSR